MNGSGFNVRLHKNFPVLSGASDALCPVIQQVVYVRKSWNWK